MDIIVFAETHPKDSYQEEGLKFYRQYAIGYNLTQEERDNFVHDYRLSEVYSFANPVITMSRRVDNRSGNLSYWEWNYYDVFENQEKASMGFGDSDYWFRSISKHNSHRDAIARNNRVNKLRSELEKLEAQITIEKFQTQSPLYAGYWNQAVAELKSKRLYKKYLDGKCPQNVLDEIKERIGGAYQAEKKIIEDRIAEIKKELESLG